METLIAYIIFGELDLKPQSVLQDSVLFCVLVCIIMITRMFSDMHSNDNCVVKVSLKCAYFSDGYDEADFCVHCQTKCHPSIHFYSMVNSIIDDHEPCAGVTLKCAQSIVCCNHSSQNLCDI